jgi:Flp pilus assembly protein TadG
VRACLGRGRCCRGESGQVSLLVLGFAVVVILLVVGTVAVTSVQLSRMRLLDAADGAALDAADSLDPDAYADGLDRSVALSDTSVRRTAVDYLGRQPKPESLLDWQVAPGTGSPDGETAVVRVIGQARVPLVGGLLDSVGGSVTITVESRARADLGRSSGP